ncbi:MAG: hypothetical protein QW244_01595 [Candidatus Pacearchaeota archaeon]
MIIYVSDSCYSDIRIPLEYYKSKLERMISLDQYTEDIASFLLLIDNERTLRGIVQDYLCEFGKDEFGLVEALKKLVPEKDEKSSKVLLYHGLCSEFRKGLKKEELKKLGIEYAVDFHHYPDNPFAYELEETIKSLDSKKYDNLMKVINDTKKREEEILKQVNEKIPIKYTSDFIKVGEFLKELDLSKQHFCLNYIIGKITDTDYMRGFIYLGAGELDAAKKMADMTNSAFNKEWLLKEIEKRKK